MSGTLNESLNVMLPSNLCQLTQSLKLSVLGGIIGVRN
jgi:hypothetical protein